MRLPAPRYVEYLNDPQSLSLSLTIARRGQAQMLIGQASHHAPTRGTRDKTELQEIWLIDILNRLAILAGTGGQGIKTNRAAIEFLNDRQEEIAIGLVQADFINLQSIERLLSYFFRNHAIG